MSFYLFFCLSFLRSNSPRRQAFSFSTVIALCCLCCAIAPQAALGQDCQSQLNRMTELVTKSTKDIEALRRDNAELDRQARRARATVVDRDKQIDSLTGDLAARQVDIASLNNANAGLKNSLDARRMELQQRDSLIAAMKAEIGALTKNLQERAAAESACKAELSAAQKDLALKNEYIGSLKSDIEAKRKEIAAQSELLAQISKEAVQTLRRDVDTLKKDVSALRAGADGTKAPAPTPKAGETKK
jgi:chromosome segregation ATPase